MIQNNLVEIGGTGRGGKQEEDHIARGREIGERTIQNKCLGGNGILFRNKGAYLVIKDIVIKVERNHDSRKKRV